MPAKLPEFVAKTMSNVLHGDTLDALEGIYFHVDSDTFEDLKVMERMLHAVAMADGEKVDLIFAKHGPGKRCEEIMLTLDKGSTDKEWEHQIVEVARNGYWQYCGHSRKARPVYERRY